MTIRFYWCHTEGCPNHGRARQMSDLTDTKCPGCRQVMKLAAPGEEFDAKEKT